MITVLTPTYNRAYILERLFQSLLLQSVPLEWIIVDDGSTDKTHDLVISFQSRSPFSISYFYQENSGKHIALNTGIQQAKGEYICIVDSDDMLTNYALARAENAIRTLPVTASGLCFRKAYLNGILIGIKTSSTTSLILSPNEAGHLFQGDLAYIFKTIALKSNPFPMIQGEKFVPELLIWNRIADNSEIIFFPSEIICLCEYLPDGYSANFKQNLQQNPKGFALFYRDQIRRERSVLQRLKYTMRLLQCLFYSLRNFVN